MKLSDLREPLAITMWDFSWLERRWPGAGYEDYDLILDELVERGYNAVRMDAYPHLVAQDPQKTWTIIPCWNQQCWGSPARNKVRVQPLLNEFIRKCADRGVWVALSTWFQRVEETDLNLILSPRHHAEIWKRTLDTIAAEGLLDAILYVDFCNEWPMACWAPFFSPIEAGERKWYGSESLKWMAESVAELKRSFPEIPYTYSYVGPQGFSNDQLETIRESNDFIETHLCMANANGCDFNKRIGYHFEPFDPKGYEQVAKHAQRLYQADPLYWKRILEQYIDQAVADADMLGLPMITTECWGIVDYKDWPLLDWEWVKDSCAHGVQYAADKGRWLAMATSNFCGPQFVGMWRDVDWHRELTAIIKTAKLPVYDEQTKRWGQQK